MSEVFDRWLQNYVIQGEQLGRIKHSTAHVFRCTVRRHFRPLFGAYRSDRLHADAITGWVNECAKQVAAQTLAPKTFNNHLTLLRSILKWARQERFMKHDPVQHIKRLEQPHVERDILEPHELRALLEEAKRSQLDYTILKTFASTGLRKGEVFGLKWGDLLRSPDGTGGQLYIRRAIVMGKLTTPKTRNSVRVVDVPKGLLDELVIYRAMYPPMEGDYIFRTSKGTHFLPNNWYNRRFIPLVQSAGLKPFGLHALRHTYVSLLIAQGENIKYIQRQVGHATIQMTLDTYGHLLRETSTAAMARLDQRLSLNTVNSELTKLALPARNTVQDEHVSEPVNLLENQTTRG